MLYQLKKTKKEYSRVKRITLSDIGWLEKDLQTLISEHLQDFIYADDLMVIFNERDGQEEPDILALDKDGDLFIFELKRWEGRQENLLQVLRYGQIFGSSSYDELNEMYKTYDGEKNLIEAHERYFGLEDARLEKSDFNRNQHYIVVTNGLDQDTVEAITYWDKNGLKIDAIIYWIFEIDSNHYIEFNMYSPIEGFLEYESHCYIVNTNMKSNPSYTEEMLSEKKVAAYFPGWREKITRLQKGDTVFLYKNEVGIIAFGDASGKLQKKDCEGHKDYEYFMRLDNFVKLKTPISAYEMKTIAEKSFPWQQTLYSISEDSKECLLKEIHKNHMK